MARSAKTELLRALRSRRKYLPPVSREAMRLFYELVRRTGLNWSGLQRMTRNGRNVFDLHPPIDVRMLAAGDK